MTTKNLSRRGFLASSAASAFLAASTSGLTASRAESIDGRPSPSKPSPAGNSGQWTIPACAWHRPLGSLPRTRQNYPVTGLDTLTRTKKGIPLGGIGAGNFMYNLCGSFGPWHLKAGRYEERFLAQAAFHVREEVDGKLVNARTLATEDVVTAWPTLAPGDGHYYALFPKGWCTYDGFKADISLQFFSPIIKDNYRETSFPVGLFLFKVTNPTSAKIAVSLMFTFPNAPYTGPQNTPLAVKGPHEIDQSKRERKGLQNKVIQDSKAGITAIQMSANHPDNPSETQGSEWCIATTHAASYVEEWNGSGDGADIWNAFQRNGTLNNNSLAHGSDLPAGALCTTLELEPGKSASIPFVLSWHFPEIEFGAGTRWRRRYTEWFPAGPGRAFEIAKQGLLQRDQWLELIDEWQRPIIENDAYPDWLKQGLLNELYLSTFGGSFWENGCITKQKKFGNRPGQHLSFVMECQEYPYAESFDVRHHASRSNRDLWPRNERDLLLVYADFIMDTGDGSCPHDAGEVGDDPFFKYDAYGRGYNQSPEGIPGRITTPWSELSPKFIQQSHAYWHKTMDDSFLAEVWPALVRSFRYQITTDINGDGLSEMKSSEYIGNKMFNAVLWLGALEALVQMAEHLKDQPILNEAARELKKARSSAERQFWNAGLGYYQFNETNHDIMGDGMLGQRYVDVTGLAPVLDPERIASHYRQLFKRSVLPLRDLNDDGVGDIGIANALHPDSTPGVGDSEYAHQFEVWTGVSYCAAANQYHWGTRMSDGALQANALLAAWGVYYVTWVNEQTAYWFSTPEAWRLDDPQNFRALMYQRARGIWEFAMEVGACPTKTLPV